MDYDDDDNYDSGGRSDGYRAPPRQQDRGGARKDMGDVLKEKVGLGDDGKLEVFGKSFDLGLPPELAVLVRPAVTQALTVASLKGASTAGKWGTKVSGIVLEKDHASKVGKAAYYTWLFGLNAANVVLSIKKTVQDGFRDMHELQEQAKPLLCVNDDQHVNIGQVLTCKNTILVHARAKAREKFKHNLAGTLANTISALPSILMGYNQARLDTIMNPKLIWESQHTKGMAEAETNAARRASGDLTAPITPAEESNLKAAKQLRAEMIDSRKRQVSPEFKAEQDENTKKRIAQYRRPTTAEDYASLEPPLARLYKQKESLNLTKEENALLGSLKKSPSELKDQLRKIEQLRGLRSKTFPADGSAVEAEFENMRSQEYLKAELRRARDRSRDVWKKELKEGRQARKNHVAGVKEVGSASHEDKEKAMISMFSWGDDPNFSKRMWGPIRHPKTTDNYAIDYKKNIKNLMPLPYASGLIGDAIDRKLSNKELPDTAWDKLMALQAYVERHHNPEHAQVAADVQNIFKQHARDLGLTYHLSGHGYEETTNAIADAIVEQKLHPQALANILDDKKIVVFGKDDADFGDLKDVKQQLELLVSRYSKADDKDVFKEISKQELKKFYHDMPQEEKPFFTMLFPPGVLEKAGVPRDEVARNREEGMQNFVEDLADKVRLLIGAGHDEIRKQGVKGKYIAPIEALESGFRRADRDGEAADFIRDNLKDVTKAVRNIETSAKKPGEMWKDFVARGQSQQEEQGSRSPLDHASRESGDEMHIGG